jgi:hypothetical protein
VVVHPKFDTYFADLQRVCEFLKDNVHVWGPLATVLPALRQAVWGPRLRHPALRWVSQPSGSICLCIPAPPWISTWIIAAHARECFWCNFGGVLFYFCLLRRTVSRGWGWSMTGWSIYDCSCYSFQRHFFSYMCTSSLSHDLCLDANNHYHMHPILVQAEEKWHQETRNQWI